MIFKVDKVRKKSTTSTVYYDKVHLENKIKSSAIYVFVCAKIVSMRQRKCEDAMIIYWSLNLTLIH